MLSPENPVSTILKWVDEFKGGDPDEKISCPRVSLKVVNLKDGNKKVQALSLGDFVIETDRQAVKHFVVSRYRALLKNHTQEQADTMVIFLVENLVATLLNPTKIADNSAKTPHSYRFARLYELHSMGVVVETKPNTPRKNLVTIHFMSRGEYIKLKDITA